MKYDECHIINNVQLSNLDSSWLFGGLVPKRVEWFGKGITGKLENWEMMNVYD
jgi:hypothetical protein